MELIFLYVHDYRGISEQSFNLNSRFDIQVAKAPGSNTLELTFSLNEEYVALFPSNILNVTGVVGKNGAGKSSLFHCIKMIAGQLARLTSPTAFSVLDSQKKIVYTYFYRGGGLEEMEALEVRISNAGDEIGEYKIAKPKPFQIKRLFMPSEVKNLHFQFDEKVLCCYLTNTFDSAREDIFSGILNFSTNTLLENFLKTYIQDQIDKEKESLKAGNPPSVDLFPSHVYSYHLQELKRLLHFVSYFKAKKISGLPDLPKYINLDFNLDDFEHLMHKDAKSSILFSAEDLKDFNLKAIQQLSKELDARQAFRKFILLFAFYHILRWDLFKQNRVSGEVVYNTIKGLRKAGDTLFDDLKSFLDPLEMDLEDTQKGRAVKEILGSSFDNALSKTKFMPEVRERGNLKRFVVDADAGLWDLLNLIGQLNSNPIRGFLTFSWHGISAGEEAFLNHFARLYSIRGNIGDRTVWLMIDEGDLYFHPQWQKEYLNRLISYVKILFPKKKFQIIISTHSPFVVSDLPRKNLVFLDKIDGKCSVVASENRPNTFGANIHELFTESFFLQDGLMGEFARETISKLIEEINRQKTISYDYYQSKLKNRISIIGEQFIKAKLLEMVSRKADSVEVVDDVIGLRESELENLRTIRDQKRKEDDTNTAR